MNTILFEGSYDRAVTWIGDNQEHGFSIQSITTLIVRDDEERHSNTGICYTVARERIVWCVVMVN